MPHLEVQVDFDFEPPRVALRFFDVDDGDRDLIRMQRLHNMAASMRKHTDPDYPEIDNRLLRQLSPDLNRPSVIRQNFNLLLLDRRRFDRLLAAFEDMPERFLLKGGRQMYTAEVQAAPVQFELNCRGKESILAAVVCLPDGQTKAWSLVRGELQGKTLEAVVNEQLVKLELPVARELLDRVFGQDNPRVPTDALEQHLPALLNYRLDALAVGDCVEHRQETAAARIALACEGADIVLRPRIGKALVRHTDSCLPNSFRRIRKNRFVVTEFDSPDLPALRRLLARVPCQERADSYLVTGSPAQVAQLSRELRALPPTVALDAPDQLRSLLKEPQPVDTQVRAKEGAGWFELEVSCRIGSVDLSARELRELTQRTEGASCFRSRDGQWLQADEAELAAVRATLDELVIRDGERHAHDQAASTLNRLQALPNLRLDGSAQAIAQRLAQGTAVPPLQLPGRLKDLLRPYQRHGVEFFHSRAAYGIGALLADDMGLGKTVQMLAYLATAKATGHRLRVLIVCPASVVAVWQDEVARFAPELGIAALTGNADERLEQIENASDLTICTYAVARIDALILQDVEWSAIVLDEAQHIKNPTAQVTEAIRGMKADQRFALTGTPLENRLDDLWSIVDFLNPGYFGTLDRFRTDYGQQSWRRNDLPERLAPLMLRRTKGEVAPELPPRSDEIIRLPMADDQRQLYLAQLKKARQQVAGQGALQVLAALTRLRQICCDPRLINPDAPMSSAKLDCLLEMLTEALAEGHSALVFSQFPSVFTYLAQEFQDRHWQHAILTGETPTHRRRKLVQKFQNDPQPGVFLLSLRAAGTGLTLTRADYVFMLDPWWNPAVENQAIDRTHRIGQDKPVFAYRLVARDSIEEKVVALQEDKQQLFEDVIENAGTMGKSRSTDELLALLA